MAEILEVEVIEVQPVSLSSFMQNKEPDLSDLRLNEIANREYGDFRFRADYDDIAAIIELRHSGFDPCRDFDDCLLDVLMKYRSARVIP